jgi:hypothetical protein
MITADTITVHETTLTAINGELLTIDKSTAASENSTWRLAMALQDDGKLRDSLLEYGKSKEQSAAVLEELRQRLPIFVEYDARIELAREAGDKVALEALRNRVTRSLTQALIRACQVATYATNHGQTLAFTASKKPAVSVNNALETRSLGGVLKQYNKWRGSNSGGKQRPNASGSDSPIDAAEQSAKKQPQTATVAEATAFVFRSIAKYDAGAFNELKSDFGSDAANQLQDLLLHLIDVFGLAEAERLYTQAA